MNAAALASASLAFAGALSCTSRPASTVPAPARDVQAAAPGERVPAFPDSITAGWGLPPLAGDSTIYLLGDTVVHAEVSVSPAYAVTTRPARVSLRALARDTGHGRPRYVPVAYAACPFVLRLYHDRSRVGSPVWRSDAAARREVACPTAAREPRRGEIEVEWEVPAVLGDSLAAGHYAFSYTLRLADGRALEYEAGDAYLATDPAPVVRDRSGLRMSARTEVLGQAPRTLRTTVTIANVGEHTVAFSHGACTPVVRLYRTPQRTRPPAWRSEHRTPPGSTSTYDCIARLFHAAVRPGESTAFAPTIPLYEVLGDSLPAGRYYASAELELLDSNLPADRQASPYTVDAGRVELTRAPDPLPATRTVDGLTYTATTRLVREGATGADVVRTLVMVTNTGQSRATSEVARDCPVAAFAYRSAALRDSVPLQASTWASRNLCYNYGHRFALAPGQSWVFAQDVPAAEIAARGGPGRYWFTARLWGYRHVITIAAGDVELTR